jgi:hypothetical protein
MTNEQYILGQGIIFPLVIDSDGKVPLANTSDLIKSSINAVLTWPIRDRFFIPEFGSRLQELLEEPNTSLLRSLVRQFVIESISKWEKRITLLDCTLVIKDNGQLDINLTYYINANNQVDNFIFPFYTQIKY